MNHVKLQGCTWWDGKWCQEKTSHEIPWFSYGKNQGFEASKNGPKLLSSITKNHIADQENHHELISCLPSKSEPLVFSVWPVGFVDLSRCSKPGFPLENDGSNDLPSLKINIDTHKIVIIFFLRTHMFSKPSFFGYLLARFRGKCTY